MSDVVPRRVADFTILKPMITSGPHTLLLAEAPERLGLLGADGGPVRVTVKTIEHPSSEADFRRVANQVRRYAAVSSPALLPVYEIGRQDSLLYIVYPSVEPSGLADNNPQRTRVAVLNAVAMAAQGAHALHEAGIAHSAIKPSRIYPTKDGGVLGHIGLTQLLNPGMTIDNQDQADTMEYVAPELIQGRSASRSSDIWALAATLHRCLTNQPLYPDMPANSPLAAIRHILNSRPRLSDALRSGELRIIEAATSFDPGDRPPTAKEFAQLVLDEAARHAKQANQ